MSDVVLSAAVRSNLLSLQNTASLLTKTQQHLSTGLRVNSALDDPTAFFTADFLNSRANDLSRLLNSAGLAVQTLQAADDGISSITKLVESAQATARQALQTAQGAATAATVTGTGASIQADVNAVKVGSGSFDTSSAAGSFTVNGTTVNFAQNDTLTEVKDAINTALSGAGINITASEDGSAITLTAGDPNTAITLGGSNLAAVGLDSTNDTANVNLLNQSEVSAGDTLTVKVGSGAVQTITFGTNSGEVSTVAELNTALGNLTGATASIDASGNITLTADNTTDSIVVGGDAADNFGLTAGTTAPTTATSTARANLESQYNELMTQIDQLAADAGFNGINLLKNDDLKVTFNEDGSSSLTIQGVSFDSAGLSLSAISSGGFQSDTTINSTLTSLSAAITTLRTQSSTFGSNLSVVETRQDFTNNLINTLQSGAAGLTLADTNEEGANMLALQTRQQLSTVSLSLAAQADQSVLRLF